MMLMMCHSSKTTYLSLENLGQISSNLLLKFKFAFPSEIVLHMFIFRCQNVLTCEMKSQNKY
jgi:hypothetical protein